MKKILLYTSIILTASFFFSCDDTISGEQIDGIEIPSRNVSYFEYIQPVFTVKCSYSGCHDSISRAGGVDLTSWSRATSDPSVVFPYQPANSKLIWSIEGQTGSQMPPLGYYPLTNNQLEGIKTWIAEGAQNN